MKSYFFRIVAIGLSLVCLGMAGCTQMPTEKTGVADMRPGISFRVEAEGNLSQQGLLPGTPKRMARSAYPKTHGCPATRKYSITRKYCL